MATFHVTEYFHLTGKIWLFDCKAPEGHLVALAFNHSLAHLCNWNVDASSLIHCLCKSCTGMEALSGNVNSKISSYSFLWGVFWQPNPMKTVYKYSLTCTNLPKLFTNYVRAKFIQKHFSTACRRNHFLLLCCFASVSFSVSFLPALLKATQSLQGTSSVHYCCGDKETELACTHFAGRPGKVVARRP